MNAPEERLIHHRDARVEKAPVIGAPSPRPPESPSHQTAACIAQMCAEMFETAQVEADIASDYVA